MSMTLTRTMVRSAEAEAEMRNSYAVWMLDRE